MKSNDADAADKYQRYVLWVGVIAALSAVGQALIAGWQAWESQKIGEKMEAQVEQFMRVSKDIAASFDSSNKNNKEALGETVKLAKESIDVSIQTHCADQRAWLSVSEYKQEEEPSVGKARLILMLANTGKTPALNASTVAHYGFLPVAPPAAFGGPENWNGVTSIFPGRVHAGVPLVLDSLATNQIIEDYKQKRIYLYVRTLTCYKDIHGNTHWMTSCAKHVFGEPLGVFAYCPTGTDFGTYSSERVCKGYKKSTRGEVMKPAITSLQVN